MPRIVPIASRDCVTGPLNLPVDPEDRPSHAPLAERWTWFEDKQTSPPATS